MIKKLILPAMRTFVLGALILGLILFLPAWTFNYWQAWLFIFVFLACVTGIGLYLSINDPVLLERRKKVGPAAEQSPVQKIIMSIALVGILALLVICALDHRFSWTRVPTWLSLLGDGLIALGLYLNLLVFKENSFGGSSIETVAEQKVIATGPYARIRHPMYLGVLVMMIGVPLALASYWGLAVLALISPGMIWRILDEEKLLVQQLPGYVAYMQKVRFRLVPYLW